MTTRPDRTVHARIGATEIVRYDRQGKWFFEGLTSRGQITLGEAAKLASEWGSGDGHVFFGRPGGKTFDAKVRAR